MYSGRASHVAEALYHQTNMMRMTTSTANSVNSVGANVRTAACTLSTCGSVPDICVRARVCRACALAHTCAATKTLVSNSNEHAHAKANVSRRAWQYSIVYTHTHGKYLLMCRPGRSNGCLAPSPLVSSVRGDAMTTGGAQRDTPDVLACLPLSVHMIN
jgi:endonuclease III